VGAGYAALFSGAPILLIFLADPIVLHAFLRAGSPALPIAAHINSIVLWGFIPFGVAFVFSGVVRATGAVWPPLLAIVVALWGVRIPFANLMIPRWGADAVWASFPLGSLVTLALSIAYYRWGGWRKMRPINTRPHGQVPDVGLSPPGGLEESEVAADAAQGLSRPSRRKPASETPAE
jgi:Na+-driven multidrug efflux pump